ncbi:unnamed protein product [Cyclocybe aegerita]|uniref:Uncharacterized protein n=1 Tax=Cyclocybe aegerita TaxID=1973307 RepID=A0A8S0W4M1_CYCAE|nr:unnamed protein product [Cyclocybe aegerita]
MLECESERKKERRLNCRRGPNSLQSRVDAKQCLLVRVFIALSSSSFFPLSMPDGPKGQLEDIRSKDKHLNLWRLCPHQMKQLRDDCKGYERDMMFYKKDYPGQDGRVDTAIISPIKIQLRKLDAEARLSPPPEQHELNRKVEKLREQLRLAFELINIERKMRLQMPQLTRRIFP